MRSALFVQSFSSVEYIPPRVGLNRVCLRMKAEYFTVVVVSTRSCWCDNSRRANEGGPHRAVLGKQ
jgi:hypothetical protein